MKNMKKYNTDIVIIGGGISGLYTAKKCIENGLSVLLLEKSQQLGGRIHTIYQPPYQYEAGAGRFNKNHILLRNLLKQYGLHEVANSKKHTYNGNPSPAETLLKRVIKEARTVPHTTLQTMTFRSFCESVLGKSNTIELINAFGYNAEFELANASSAIDMFRRDFLEGTSYFSCREGLSELVNRIEAHIAPYSTIYKSTRVTNIETKNDIFIVHANDAMGYPRKYVGKVVICAIPKNDLEQLSQFTQQQRILLDSVSPVSLHRIYGAFPTRSWFNALSKTTTHDHIRQFIPINKSNGLAMVSYSDTDDADYWKKQADKGSEHLKKEVLKHLHAVFPEIPAIPQPKWLDSHYWPAGVHMWKKGIDSSQVMPKVQHIMGRFYIVGEAYCKIQGWIEGALESVEEIIPQVLHDLFPSQYGGYKVYNKSDLLMLKKNQPSLKWITLQHPMTGETHIIDVTEWSYQHPGGDVYSKYIHKDITNVFQKVGYHKNFIGGWKDNVIDAINKYTIGIVR
jgi:monoamine oxidase